MNILLIDDLHQAITCAGVAKKGGKFLEKSDLTIIDHAYIAIEEQTIAHIGTVNDSQYQIWKQKANQTITATGQIAFPGFIDCHTHPTFGGDRSQEFEQKIEGKTYQEIAAEGGGINYTVKQTRIASASELSNKALKTFNHFLSLGITTCEAKSGYGLSTESEIKQLESIVTASKHTKLEVIPTFLGAHGFPPEFKNYHNAYVNEICENMLPTVVQQKLSTICDIFIEENYFTIEQARKILSKAQSLGMQVKIHADEFTNTNGAALSAEFNALSADHLEKSDNDGIRAMSLKNVVAVLLPGTSYYSNLEYTNPKPFLENGVPIAIATDFNPGSCVCDNLFLVMNMAALKMRLPPFQIIAATTFNAAKAIGLETKIGSLEIGKQADIAIYDIPNYSYLMYHIGRNFVTHVIKKGQPQ